MLAHTNNVDIIINNKFEGHNLLKHLKFFKMITKRQMPNKFEDIIFQSGDSVRPLVSDAYLATSEGSADQP